MFPIGPRTLFELSLIAISLCTALAVRSDLRWRVALLLIALGLPAAFLWPLSPTDQYAGLAYLVVIVPSFIAITLGAVCGSFSRRFNVAPVIIVSAIVSTAGVCGALVLWNQYLPSGCLEEPLQVRIAGNVLYLPPEMRPRVENGDSIDFFGRTDRKTDHAKLCRRGRNGTRPVEVDTVWITPASNHDEMTDVCNGRKPPAWCNIYSPAPYRHIGKVLIAPMAEPGFPLPYWRKGGSLRVEQMGDLAEGSVCLAPDGRAVTQCWMWAPFGDGFRLTVSTNNLDKSFSGMPVEKAREMIVTARNMTLAIISR